MDAVEKILTNLIDSMHKHMAKGNGAKKIDVEVEIEKASDSVETKPREATAFDKFLQSERDKKAKPKSTEMNIMAAIPKKKVKK